VTVRSLDGKSPRIAESAFVSEAAYLIGDVEVGPQSSVWPGVVIRADSGKIVIGARSNVQDNTVIHADADASIGDDVTIGHGVVCHAKYIGDGALIGNGAVMNDGVEVGEGSLVAAGAVLPERVVIPAGSLVRGMPGRVLGPVRNRHLELMRGAAKSYVDRLGRYKEAGLQG
jgi:carbonic anhydrase/acetyltransferase-like protein (isoleucine patch superfamily)